MEAAAAIPQIVACHHQPKVAQTRSALFAMSVDLLRIADEVDWLLQQRHDADSEHVKKLAQSRMEPGGLE